MKFTYTPLAIALTLIANQAFAVEELIVTGSYSPVSAEQLSSSVTVINRDQLQQLSNHSLVDALRQVPGLWVEEQGGPGGITSIALRGAESNHTLVLVDGVQLNDPTNTRGGAFDLGNINIETIERIEIIRGAQSTVYGSDALAGVIQIITTSPGEKSTQLNASIGESDFRTAGVNTRGEINNLGYALSLQAKDAGEPVLGSTAKNTELSTKLEWSDERQSLAGSYRYFDGERTAFPEQSGGPLHAQNRSLDTSEFTDKSAAFNWQFKINDLWNSSARATWYNRVEQLDSPGIEPYYAVPPNGANSDFTRTLFTWINTVGDDKKLWSNFGVETKKEKGESKGYLNFGELMPVDFDMSRRINSTFVNVNAFATQNLLLQASARHDATQHGDANTSLQTGARLTLNEQTHLFANWGEGFKLPSFSALGHPLVGNKDLLPEESTTWDTGIEWSSATVQTRFSYFNNQYKNLIDFDSESFRNVNRTRVDSKGAEGELSWQASDALSLRAEATYTDIKVRSSNTHLLGRPQTTLGASAGYNFNQTVKLNLNYLWVDSRFAVSLYSGDGVEETLPAYSRVDANLSWQLNEQFTLSASLTNALDKHYETDIGFPAPGNSARVKLEVRL